MHIISRDFYNRSTDTVAHDLLGKYVVRNIKGREHIGMISETEAYGGPEDLASHSRFGPKGRSEILFGPPGHAYVYLIYGIYNCLNIVTQPEGVGSGVLIRALIPIKNIQGKTSGPGLLCQSLQIDRKLKGHDVTQKGELYLIDPQEPLDQYQIITTPRIGVSYAGEWAEKPLRYALIPR